MITICSECEKFLQEDELVLEKYCAILDAWKKKQLYRAYLFADGSSCYTIWELENQGLIVSQEILCEKDRSLFIAEILVTPRDCPHIPECKDDFMSIFN